MTMKVAVTGSSGLIGRAVCRLLEARGDIVRRVDRTLPAPARCYDLRSFSEAEIALYDVEAVIHLAGQRTSVAQQQSRGYDLLTDNLLIDLNVFRALRRWRITRGVYASTVSVYGTRSNDAQVYPKGLPEHLGGSFVPDGSVRYSAWGKLTAERVIEAWAEVEDHRFQVVRLVNTYGPWDDFSPGRSLIVPSLIYRTLEGDPGPLRVWGDGSAERDLLYVEDAAKGIIAALDHRTRGVWNLGTGWGVKVKKIVETVLSACGSKRKPLYDETSPTGAVRKVVDPSKAKRELGWQAETSLVEGVRATVEWFRAQQEAKTG